MLIAHEAGWRAIWVLGAAECVFWGILYYAFSVLLVPVAHELDASQALVAGSFSVGLGISALLAPAVGRALDRGRGVALIRGGAFAATVLLIAWSTVSGVIALYAVWCGLGACMALVLYESAFALVTRATIEPARRLRALASVTVLGGLASTVFLPITGFGVAHIGWRATLLVLAVAWLLGWWMLEHYALRDFERADRAAVPRATATEAVSRDGIVVLALPFVAGTFAAMAVTTVVVPALVARGQRIDHAALVLAGLGVMQLPGRVWMWRGARGASIDAMLLWPLVLQVIGLAVLAFAGGLGVAFVGVALFGVGAGMHSLARPWIVAQLYGVGSAGRINGSIARAAGFSRALGPVGAAAAFGRCGSASVFTALALLLLAMLPLAIALKRRAARAPGALP